jgi:hypothetical protein
VARTESGADSGRVSVRPEREEGSAGKETDGGEKASEVRAKNGE